MAVFGARVGYGQVEPNHLSAQRTSQIYAQLPANNAAFGGADAKLENGQFVKYDYAAGNVDLTGKGEWMMVFNEVKLYDDRWRESYADYAMKAKDMVDGVMVPRVIKTNVGDIYTTNAVEAGAEAAKGKLLTPNPSTGFLKASAEGAEDMVWQVVAETTMPDGKKAVKLQRIK